MSSAGPEARSWCSPATGRWLPGSVAGLLWLALGHLPGWSSLPAAEPDTARQANAAPSTNAASTADAGNPIDFVRDIEPILARSCRSCHGADKQEGGLRLHRQADALAGGDSGAALVPGNSAESRLFRYVTGKNDEGTRMPPEGEGQPLSNQQIALLRAWIDQGALWPETAAARVSEKKHWAFQPVARPELPTVQNAAWPRNEIDRFILATLEQHRVPPSPEADKATLLRRLSLDLLGLPPTPADLADFLADTRPDAYQRLVERLLASPHYGEHWGRFWLDQARYADSDGYEKDLPRPHAWRWRQWVIEALNRDEPFDQFTIEQLAGDLLPNATAEQRVATGFHRNTLTNREGGIDKEEDRVKNTIDRVNTTGTVWLGLTVGCGQCHSHKYDPLTQREYYSLVAFFNSLEEQDLPAPTAEQQRAYLPLKHKHDAEHAALAAELNQRQDAAFAARQAVWEAQASGQLISWQPQTPTEATAAQGTRLAIAADGSVTAGGKSPERDEYTLVFPPPGGAISAVRLEVLTDASLPKQGPGRSSSGNFVLTEVKLWAEPAAKPLAFHQAQADFHQVSKPATKFAIAATWDNDATTGWAIAPQLGQPHQAVWVVAAPFNPEQSGRPWKLVLEQNYGQQHTLGRFRVSVTSAANPLAGANLPDAVAAALKKPRAQRTAQQQQLITAHYLTLDPQLSALAAKLAAHARSAPVDPGQATKAQVLSELKQPRTTHVLTRGDFLRPGQPVEADTPAFLPPLSDNLSGSSQRPTRLDLARWLVDKRHPLTSRVTVNRIWQRYFGRGLVVTSEDFGLQGQPPSHPELLDWLSARLMDQGWSLKQLHRQIVCSATYRQASDLRLELLARDPQNVWLARQSRLRVEAEVIRDLALSVGGLLTPTVGGPSVRPPQPKGVSELTYANSAKWVESQGADRYRRGLYTFFQRTSPYPMLMTFDAPDSNVCAVRRERSNTPLQALTLLNDAVFVESAQALGARVLRETPGEFSNPEALTAARIDYLFRVALCRQPSTAEAERLTRLHGQLSSLTLAAAEPELKQLVGSHAPADGNWSAAAAWVALARTMLNLDEFVTRE